MKRLFPLYRRMGPAERGFTLMEMLIVVAIGGILAAVAAPSLVSVIESNRRTIISNQLMEDLAYTRRMALALSSDTYMCGSSGIASPPCVSPPPYAMDWSKGWYVVLPDNGTNWALRVPQVLTSGWKVDAYLGINTSIVFHPQSLADGFGHFTIYRSGSATAACVVVNSAGRARAYTATVATGVVSTATGQDPCTS